MKKEIEILIERYKFRIASKQRQRDFYESTGKGGACISSTGEIQAYNAVIKDLKQLIT